jgi:SAM-dependent methyltransferase
VTIEDRWLSAAWTFVGARVPPPPATVLEIGCGPLGGFVPELINLGYDAVGIDPNAPDGPEYRRVKFEDADPPRLADTIIASVSLHHVADLDQIVDRVATALHPTGTLVVVEWAWERFDEATAEWCFARLAPSTDAGHGWLRRHEERWRASGQSWDAYFQEWAKQERLHPSARILEALGARFEPDFIGDGPYFFCDLDETTEADERDAINRGEIKPACVRYVATRR